LDTTEKEVGDKYVGVLRRRVEQCFSTGGTWRTTS